MTLSSGFLKRKCNAATERTASIKYVLPSRAKRGTSFCQMSVLAGEFITRVLDVLLMYWCHSWNSRSLSPCLVMDVMMGTEGSVSEGVEDVEGGERREGDIRWSSYTGIPAVDGAVVDVIVIEPDDVGADTGA